MNFTNEIVSVIVGGTSGIGKAVAIALGQRPGRVEIATGNVRESAMNAALESVAKILARELSPIRVNIVSPGLTDTEAYGGMADVARRSMLERAAANLPAGRYGRPEDLAAAYLFAIDNPFVTGSVIDVEGGALIN